MTPDMRLRRTIWAALAVSMVIYAFIAYITKLPRRYPTFDAAFHSPIVIGAYVGAALVFLIGLFWWFGRPDLPPRLRMIMSLAMFEAAAVFGLCAAFIAGDWRLYLAPWALAMIGFLRAFPLSEPT